MWPAVGHGGHGGEVARAQACGQVGFETSTFPRTLQDHRPPLPAHAMAPHNGSMSKPSISPVKWGAAQDQWAAAVPNLPLLHILPVPGHGPEDVLFLDGSILTGLDDGRIVKVSQDGWQIEVVGDTQGRPLGLEAHPDGRVVVCDAVKGLLMLDPASGRLDTLVPVGQENLRVCNNAAVAQDGTIYFSDSSQRFELEHWTADLLEHSGTGRLLRRTPTGAWTSWPPDCSSRTVSLWLATMW